MGKELFTRELLDEFKARKMTLTQISTEIYGHTENYRNIRRAYKRHGIEPFRIKALKPSKEVLEEMICNRGMTPYQVADELGYGPLGWSNIYAYCREYGLKFDFTSNAEAKKVEISGEIASILYGSFLGDGYITPGGALTLCHGEKQLDYLEWKASMLSSIMCGVMERREANEPPYSHLPTYYAKSRVLPFLKDMRKKLYPAEGGRPVTPIVESPHFDEMALAVWYFDDGTRSKYNCRFCTNRYSLESVRELMDALETRFELKSVLDTVKGTASGDTQYMIRLNKDSASRLFSIVEKAMPYIPPSVKHKLPGQ